MGLRRIIRNLVRRPGFSLLAVATLALGMGANLGVFAYLTYLLHPAVEAPAPQQVVWIHQATEAGPDGWPAHADWQHLRRTTGGVLEQHAAYRIFSSSAVLPRRTFHAWGFAVGGDYFSLFGARARLGRLLTAADDRPGAAPVVVLSDACWRSRFGADPEVVGTELRLDGRHPYTVVGVTEPGFQGHGFALGLYVPMGSAAPLLGSLEAPVSALARLSGGADLGAARAVLAARAAALDAADGTEEGSREERRFVVRRAGEWTGRSGDPLVARAPVILAAVLVLLLLACANVAGLLLARAAERRWELALRSALGAGRHHLAAGPLLEASLLAMAGALGGIGLGAGLVRLIEAYLERTTPIGFGDWAAGSHIAWNPGLVGTFLVLLVTGVTVLCALVPVVGSSRHDPAVALRGDVGAGRRRPRLRSLLVVGQVALSVVLLVTAALLARSLAVTHGEDPGFDSAGLQVAALYLPRPAPADGDAPSGAGEEGLRRYDELLRSARDLPGVESAALVQRLPLTGWARSVAVGVPGGEAPLQADLEVVSDGAFETLRVPLLRGRAFDRRDAAAGVRTAVVSRGAAERLWPGEDPVGRRLRIGEGEDGEDYEVLGVAGDVRGRGLARPPSPTVYVHHHQRPARRLTLLLRAPAAVAGPLRDLLARRHPEMAVIDQVPFSEQVRRSLFEARMYRDLALGAGASGLALALLGVFGLLRYEVEGRRREIGVRRALGATAADVHRRVLGSAGRLLAVGCVLGLAVAGAAAHLLGGLLHGVAPLDPVSFVAVPVVLAAAGLVAAWLPARRAARVEPARVLRQE